MRRIIKAAVCIVAIPAFLAGTGCAPKSEPVAEEPKGQGIAITSPAFRAGQPIPARHTGDGDDLSPPLQWSGIPQEARSLVIICDDPDAPRGTFVHWLLYDLPASEKGLPEGVPRDEKLPSGASQGTNDFGRYGYIGPSPPSGPVHHYHFRLYALSAPTGLKPGASRGDLDAAMKGRVIATGELVGTYKR